MPEQRICSFSGDVIEPGTGLMFIRATVQYMVRQQQGSQESVAKAKLSQGKVDPPLRKVESSDNHLGRHNRRPNRRGWSQPMVELLWRLPMLWKLMA